MVISFKERPFHLNDEDITWVKETLAGLSLNEKVGQLFCLVLAKDDITSIERTISEIGLEPAGYMSRAFGGRKVQENYRHLQSAARIPLLLAANVERGGEGTATEGTFFGSQMEVAATDNEEMAYRLGLVSGRESAACGCNWVFGPVADIDYNFSNPITNTRTYGSDPERVLRMTMAYMKGVQECGLAVSIKHFPGDGVDGRDQHLLTSVNSLSTDEWDRSFGLVYRGLIDAGAETVMSAHIMQPAYAKRLNPEMKDEEMLPASLSYELTTVLLREHLGFNGLVVTDASTMAGFTMLLPRERAVPAAIAAGCDIFLFTHNVKEDYGFMLAGVKDGTVSAERLDQAVTRTLALKASLKLHEKGRSELVPDQEALSVLSCDEHVRWARECADKAVTLVKDTQHILPLSPERHKRVLLYVLGDEGGFADERTNTNVRFIQRLTEGGFDVTKYDPTYVDFDGQQSTVTELRAKYDIMLYYASLRTASNQTTVRINWAQPMGANVPKWMSDLPVVFVSVDNPYHLQDVPRVKTFVNGYAANEYVIDAVVEKLMGRSQFKGISPVDAFCGLWDTRL